MSSARRRLLAIVIAGVAAGLLASSASRGPAAPGEPAKILQFQVMSGSPNPFASFDPAERAANAIRGLQGPLAPWVIRRGDGRLFTDGKIDVRVRGLVIDPDDPSVPEELRGVNPVPFFKAIVSCLTVDDGGQAVVANVSTGLFEADPEGNARINDHIGLPQPCIAPIVFVTAPDDTWFAVTGFE